MANIEGELKEKCSKTVQAFKRDLARVRSGRANSSLLEGVMVEYYGSSVPLMQLGNVNTPEARLITVQVYDAGAVEAVEKAILQADLGLNPSHEGNLVRVTVPSLTEERRKDLIKKLHKMSEDSKVALRNHRRESIDELKQQVKDKVITEDDLRKRTEGVQKILDASVKEIDELLEVKEKDMMEV